MQNLKRSDLHAEGLNLETLMEALFYRDEFLSIASHELKTPLTAMRLHTQVFKRYSTKDQSLPYSKDNVDRLVNQIDAQTSRLIKLVEDMLDISRIRSGQLCMTKDDFNVSDLLHDVVQKFSLNEINRISLKVDTNLFLWGDCERVAQVFHKIINNALKFIDENSQKMWLSAISCCMHLFSFIGISFKVILYFDYSIYHIC